MRRWNQSVQYNKISRDNMTIDFTRIDIFNVYGYPPLKSFFQIITLGKKKGGKCDEKVRKMDILTSEGKTHSWSKGHRLWIKTKRSNTLTVAKFMTFSLPSVFLLNSKLFKVRLAIPVLLVVFLKFHPASINTFFDGQYCRLGWWAAIKAKRRQCSVRNSSSWQTT